MIILNIKGFVKDLSEELLEFLKYVENSTDDTVKHSKGDLVKSIHKRVQEVKDDISMEVEFVTLLERDREKIEEGREEGRKEGRDEGRVEGREEGISLTKRVFKLSTKGCSISEIAKQCNISESNVKEILE